MRKAFHEVMRRGSWGWPSRSDTVPPEGEKFTVHAVWAIEFYTPAHAEDLITRLHRLGFADARWSTTQSLSESIRSHRSSLGESWSDLGVVARSGRGPDHVQAHLPHGVNAAFVSLHTLTPSLSALLVLFVLEDEEAERFDSVARRTDFKPRPARRSGGWEVETPSNLKRGEMRDTRRRTRELATGWLADHLPGTFASRREMMPSAEMVTTELALPHDPSSRDIHYLRFADLGSWPPLVWVSEELPHWRLVTDRDDDSVSISARRKDAFLADGDEPIDRWAMPQRVNEALGKTLVLVAAFDLVRAAHRRIAGVRDEGGRLYSARLASRRLKRIGERLLHDSLEVRTIASELHGYAQDARQFTWNASEWHGLERFADESLNDNLRQGLLRSTEALLASEARLRDGLVLNATMMASVANLRLQRWVIALTVITVATGGLAVWLAYTAQ